MRPRVVLVTGAPGSGKSTLARELARELRVPYLARDDVRGGLLFSAGAWTDALRAVPSSDEAVDLFLDLIETMLARRLSCVVEYVVRTNRSADLQRLLALMLEHQSWLEPDDVVNTLALPDFEAWRTRRGKE